MFRILFTVLLVVVLSVLLAQIHIFDETKAAYFCGELSNKKKKNKNQNKLKLLSKKFLQH